MTPTQDVPATTGGLLPCPFCGGEAHIEYASSTSVECSGCGTAMDGMFSTPEEAIAAWNRRTPVNNSPETEHVGDGMEVVFDGVAKRKLDGLLERGWKISGYSLTQDGDHGLITTGGFVGWFSVAERNDAAAGVDLSDAQAIISERDARIEGLEKHQARCATGWADALNELEAAEAQVSALRAALEPWAKEAEELAVGVPDNAVYTLADYPDLGVTDFTVGDVRNARTALNPAKGDAT